MLKKFFKIALIVYSVFVFGLFAFVKKTDMLGDGYEYTYMTESFIQHKSPEQLDTDVAIAQEKLKIQNPHVNLRPEHNGFYESNAGNKWYSYHFWLYPLVVSPIQQVIELFHGNPLRAFGITNALLYLTMLWCVYLLSASDKKVWLTLLMAMSPLISYIIWTSPEVFSASLLAMALVFYFRKNLQMAILLSGLAACQNPPILFFTVWCGCLYLWHTYKKYIDEHTFDFREFIITGLCSLPLLLSPLFYWINYSTPNLIAKIGASKLEFINFGKFLSYFFDLNQGAIVYSGLLLLVFLWLVVKNLVLKKFKYFELVIISLIMIISCLTTPNWNSGMSHVMRYFVWLYPMIVFYVVYSVDFTKQKLLGYILIANMFILCCANSWFKGDDNHGRHNVIATAMLSNYPAFYNPEHEIFTERILHQDPAFSCFVAFLDNTGEIRKILTTKDAWLELPNNEKYTIKDSDFYTNQLSKFKNDVPRYVNVTRNQIVTNGPTVEIDKKIKFSEIDEDIRGLSVKEPWGRWSDGKQVNIRLKFKTLNKNRQQIGLKIDGYPYLPPKRESLKIDIFGNDKLLKTWVFTHEHSDFENIVYVPTKDISENGNILDLNFKIHNPISPSKANDGPDHRKLGFAFFSIEVVK